MDYKGNMRKISLFRGCCFGVPLVSVMDITDKWISRPGLDIRDLRGLGNG